MLTAYTNILMSIIKYVKYIYDGTVRETESGTVMLNWDSRYLCHFSTQHLLKITKYTTKTFITMKVQEIES